MIPETSDFAVTSCLRPATRKPGPTMTPTQNLAEYENLKRTFQDTANRCHRNGHSFTPVVLDLVDMQEAGETQHATWSPGSLHKPSHISNWLSASLRHSIVNPFVTCSTGGFERGPPLGMTQAVTPGQPTPTPLLR